MSLKKENYMPRLIDKKIEDYLTVFGAISIEGPKWCGKTWTALNHANSAVYLDDEETKNKALLSLEYLFDNKHPLLIDEWNLVPRIWDTVRHKCDETSNKGIYILTCSTKLADEAQKENIHHSGAGRIGKVSMYPMSLYESSDSDGKVSLTKMYQNEPLDIKTAKVSLEQLAYYIVRGGWPSNLKTPREKCGILPKSYLNSILDKDIHDEKKRDSEKMLMLLKSLARNESTVVSKETILKDIYESNNSIESRITLDDYLDVLNRLHITANQNSYSENYRSPKRVGKAFKRHFVDPSLACAALNLTEEKIVNDLKTFGFLFESLVERDLRIYMDYLDGNIYHFRDNVTGLEVDTILEFSDGEYAAFEIKLGFNQVEEAKKNLLSLANNMTKKPKFMCVIVGYLDFAVQDKETGIYIVPITSLKP